MVWTSKAGRKRLGSSVGRLSVEAGIPGGSDATNLAESIGTLLRTARSRYADETILVEAGPTLASEFYRREPTGCPRVDELLLSRFEGEPASEAIGPAFRSRAEISELFCDAPTSVRIEESGATWRFERYRDPIVGERGPG